MVAFLRRLGPSCVRVNRGDWEGRRRRRPWKTGRLWATQSPPRPLSRRPSHESPSPHRSGGKATPLRVPRQSSRRHVANTHSTKGLHPWRTVWFRSPAGPFGSIIAQDARRRLGAGLPQVGPRPLQSGYIHPGHPRLHYIRVPRFAWPQPVGITGAERRPCATGSGRRWDDVLRSPDCDGGKPWPGGPEAAKPTTLVLRKPIG